MQKDEEFGSVGGSRPVGRGLGVPGLGHGWDTAGRYRRFAQQEAAGRSSAYESLALAVADDEVILDFLERLPTLKRQPNLLFAAARYLLDAVPDGAGLRRLVVDQGERLVEVMLERRTQTNEPARCATILPALCQLPQPLALIEVGASAGLALLVDRYSYSYDGTVVVGADRAAPTLSCHAEGPAPLPDRVPEVMWRYGVDLNPLDPASDDDVRWLECLIWPGEDGRLERLRGAVAAARRHPVTIRRGDLLDDLREVLAEAPRAGSVVVFHSAVLTYVDRPKREAFAQAVKDLSVTWLSNEGPEVLGWVPAVTERHGFVLVQDGQIVLAETDPHGTWLRWSAPLGN